MSDSYGNQKMVEALIANDKAPTISTVDTLATLKLLKQIREGADDDTYDPAFKMIAQEELKYINVAADAVHSNRLLGDKFGRGMGGVLSLAGLIKQHTDKHIYEKVLDTVINKNDAVLGITRAKLVARNLAWWEQP